MIIKTPNELEQGIDGTEGATVIWLMCHYPEHREMEERIERVVEIYPIRRYPVWIFGSALAKYGEASEVIIKRRLVARGVRAADIFCAADFGRSDSYDTVQEIFNAFSVATEKNVSRLICVSNLLQQVQVYGFSRKERVNVVFVPSRLRDWRPWYVTARIGLIPLAFLGIGKKFLPLKFVRYARARWPRWPF